MSRRKNTSARCFQTTVDKRGVETTDAFFLITAAGAQRAGGVYDEDLERRVDPAAAAATRLPDSAAEASPGARVGFTGCLWRWGFLRTRSPLVHLLDSDLKKERRERDALFTGGADVNVVVMYCRTLGWRSGLKD